MKNIKIKKIALYIALLQMLSSNALANNTGNTDIYDKGTNTNLNPSDNKLVYAIQNSILVYQRFNNNEFVPVSIFDDENTKTNQYGASQSDFNSRFSYLLEESLIWEEIQKYFPLSNFDNMDDAKLFYRSYFDQIGAVGCGYAAATDYVFRLFEGREQEFQKTFGFPMYYLKEDLPDYNYELFMLKFFNYYNIEKANDPELAKEFLLKDYYMKKLSTLKKKLNDYKAEGRKHFREWSAEEYFKWKEHETELLNAVDKYSEKVKKVRNNVSFHLPLDKKFGYFKEFLEQYGIIINTSVKAYAKDFNIDDIVASGGTTLHQIDEDGNIIAEVDIASHYFYVTDITDDGKIIVSSWGNMYIFDNKDADWTSKVVLSLTKK